MKVEDLVDLYLVQEGQIMQDEIWTEHTLPVAMYNWIAALLY